MTVLAFEKCEKGRLFTSTQLARSIRTNATVVRRLLARLVDAKLLKSYKGKGGGVELSQCPSEISLKDIYEAVSEKKLLYAPDRKAQKTCPVSCAMGKLMTEVIDGVELNSRSYLASISLEELTSRVNL